MAWDSHDLNEKSSSWRLGFHEVQASGGVNFMKSRVPEAWISWNPCLQGPGFPQGFCGVSFCPHWSIRFMTFGDEK